MDVPSYTFHIKDVDLKKFVNFERVLHTPVEGSKVFILHEVFNQILQQLDARDLFPISVIRFSELAAFGCQEWGVELNKRFIREVVTTFIKSKDEYVLVSKGKYNVEIERR